MRRLGLLWLVFLGCSTAPPTPAPSPVPAEPRLSRTADAATPNGAKRFYNLAVLGDYTDATFFRAIAGSMVQFGLHGERAVSGTLEARCT